MALKKEFKDNLSKNNKYLKTKVKQEKQKLKDTYTQMIKSLVEIIDSRDHYTRMHSHKVTEYAENTAREMGLTESEILYVKETAELHDLGKIAIPDGILSKKAKLTPREWDEIKKHPLIGSKILKPLSFLNCILDGIEQHHERYDGNGYPFRNKHEKIPVIARILAVADSYEAMTNDRPYKKAMTREKAINELRNNKGKQFDPMVVEAFIKSLVKEIL